MLDNVREWISDNLRYILLGLAIVLIVVIGFCVVRLVTGNSSSDSSEAPSAGSVKEEMLKSDKTETEAEAPAPEGETDEVQEGSGSIDTTVDDEAVSGTSAAPVSGASLVKDDTAILTLVKKYYKAVVDQDIVTLEEIVDNWNESVKTNFLQSDVIEDYRNISTYSKQGPVPNSYVIYAYFDGKISGIETLVPSLTLLYAVTGQGGGLLISDRNASSEITDYIASITSDRDVQALIADVNEQCEKAKAADPALKDYMEKQSPQNTYESEEAVTEEPQSEAAAGKRRATADVNIRQEPGGAVLGVLPTGTEVEVLEEKEGWCRISYNAGTYTVDGFVSGDFLAEVGQ